MTDWTAWWATGRYTQDVLRTLEMPAGEAFAFKKASPLDFEVCRVGGMAASRTSTVWAPLPRGAAGPGTYVDLVGPVWFTQLVWTIRDVLLHSSVVYPRPIGDQLVRLDQAARLQRQHAPIVLAAILKHTNSAALESTWRLGGDTALEALTVGCLARCTPFTAAELRDYHLQLHA